MLYFLQKSKVYINIFRIQKPVLIWMTMMTILSLDMIQPMKTSE